MEKYLINPNQKLSKINRDIYGCFSEHLGRCIYEGTYVGEDSPIPNVNGMRTDVVTALKDMGLPVLRWPGGCFADEYHWKDGIGKKEERPTMFDVYWGGVVENNSFGTHEFFELCKQIGCEAYVAGNVCSGTAQEMNDWIEYMTSDKPSTMTKLRKENGQEKPWRVKYFGVGNESYGCGGNMEPEYYADEYRRYATYLRTYDLNNKPLKVACGPSGNIPGYCHWADVVMKKAGGYMDALSLHYYAADHTYRAREFSDEGFYEVMKNAYQMDEHIQRTSEIMNRYDPQKRVVLAVDEWGIWCKPEEGTNPRFLYQQNTVRDALVAGLTLNIFNKHSDRVRMATLAQTINVLQSIALTDGEEMVRTPTYYVFKMYKDHHDNTLLGSYITAKNLCEDEKLPQLIESASMKEDGTIVSTIVNTSMSESAEVHCQIADFKVKEITAEIVTGNARDYNDFGEEEVVKICGFKNFKKTEDGFTATLPPCSVVKFLIK